MGDQEKGENPEQLPKNTGETTAEDVPPTSREEEKNQPSSSLLNLGPSGSLERGTSAHQQTTSAAGDIQHPQQKNKTAYCGACGEMLEDTEEELKNHNCSKPKCEFCDPPVIFEDYSDFVQHFESAHKDKEPIHCPYCIVKLYPRLLNETLKNHDGFTDVINGKTQLCSKGNSYYKCDDCNGETVIFKLYDDFETHKIQYHPYHKYLRKRQCGICQKKFERPEVLFDHAEKEHDTDRAIKCSYCGIFFDKFFKFPKHVTKHRKEREQQIKDGQLKTHSCPYCTKDFASEPFLKDHGEKIHNKEISFSCSECPDEKFPYSIYLEEHKKEKHPPPPIPKRAKKRTDTDKDKDEDKDKCKGVKKPRSNVGRLQK